MSQEFSRTESCILGALFKLDEFLLNQQIRTHSETVPGTFRNTSVENQGTNENDSQSDPHPEAGIFRGQTTQNFGPKNCRDTQHTLNLFLINISNTNVCIQPQSTLYSISCNVNFIRWSSTIARFNSNYALFTTWSPLTDRRGSEHPAIPTLDHAQHEHPANRIPRLHYTS